MKATLALFLLAGGVSLSAQAGSRQLGTGGASEIEGSAGGGIVPWAVIAGYGTEGEYAATAFATRVHTDDYRLGVFGAAVGLNNRVELSVASQELDLVTLGPALGMPGASIRQDVFGAKVRLYGDVLYSRGPQLSLGVQYKRNKDFLIPSLVGAEDDSGVDVYLAATKVFLAGVGGYNGFINGTLRSTRANETGLLGFGGDGKSGRSLQAEVSAGVFLNRRIAIGFDFRQKPNNLSAISEDDWADAFIAWFPNRHVSVVAAYADLGSVGTLPGQRGWYLSVQGAF